MRAKKVAAAAAALIVAGWCASGGLAGADPTHPPGPPPGPAPSPAPAAAPKTTIDKDGTYVVGKDIVPGTYSSAGPVADKVCYWKRVSGDKIVDNALTKKPQVIEIEPSDTAFKTDRCQPWQLTNCPPDCPPPQQAPPLGFPGIPGLPGFPPPSPPQSGNP